MADQDRDNVALNAISAALMERVGFLPLSARYGIARRALDEAREVAQQAWSDQPSALRCRTCGSGADDPTHDGGPRYFVTADLCHPCSRNA